MSNSRSTGQAALWVIVAILIVIVGAVVYKATKSSNYATPATTQSGYNTPTTQNNGTSGTASSENSGDPSLDSDLQAIDNSTTNIDSSLKDADSGMNDKAPDLSY